MEEQRGLKLRGEQDGFQMVTRAHNGSGVVGGDSCGRF